MLGSFRQVIIVSTRSMRFPYGFRTHPTKDITSNDESDSLASLGVGDMYLQIATTFDDSHCYPFTEFTPFTHKVSFMWHKPLLLMANESAALTD